jgi:hypothetical protein
LWSHRTRTHFVAVFSLVGAARPDSSTWTWEEIGIVLPTNVAVWVKGTHTNNCQSLAYLNGQGLSFPATY